MIAVSSSGKSFGALATYLATGRTGEERDRVAWSAARNLPTNDPELAATFMRATAAHSSKVEKPVYHVVLSFDPADVPDRETMERVADRVLERLGLAEHQVVIVAHRDRAHAHLHLLVNRVHPETGRAWERWKDQPLIQQVLREEERALGLRELSSSLDPQPGRGVHAPNILDAPPRDVDAATVAPRRESGSSARRVDELIEMLGTHERVDELTKDLYATRTDAEAARARAMQLDATFRRAEVAEQEFIRTLGAVYQDPRAARAAFSAAAREQGAAAAERVMSEEPDRFGALLIRERHVLGIRAVHSDEQARTAAPAAANAGAQTLAAERALSTAFAEAHASRVEDLFVQELRGLFADPSAARLAFVEIATRDGVNAAAAALRDETHRFARTRVAELEPSIRRDALERAASAGIEAIRARREVGREPTRQRGVIPTLPDSPGTSIDERAATRQHVDAIAGRERSIRHELDGLPGRGELEQRIAHTMERLLPHEVRKLRQAATAPQLALATSIRATIRDALLAREERLPE